MSGLVCWSGGAAGADLLWGQVTKLVGGRVVHVSFADHRPVKGVEPEDVLILAQSELDAGDDYLAKASLTMKRGHIASRAIFVRNLLRRNVWQVLPKRPVYAVSSLAPNGTVKGGTGWAVQVARDQLVPNQPERIFLFDQEQELWLEWNGVRWSGLDSPPRPEGEFAGIGSRHLNDVGRRAIQELFS